jgi:hypothetical protein
MTASAADSNSVHYYLDRKVEKMNAKLGGARQKEILLTTCGRKIILTPS